LKPAGIARRSQNQAKGSAKASPISRPSSRCTYSQKKIALKADSVMPLFINWYCDEAR
jgi:hypothetical protein